ncbi:MAG: hypothetical protein PHF86_05715 [Candidatus Nanoarchaeia archaeon]|nr:hypothetical protein [Candidatus Nanoarchaeia archaeon]
MEDIDFLYDDTNLEKSKLAEIAKEANKVPVKEDYNIVVLRKFILSVLKVFQDEEKKQLIKKELPKTGVQTLQIKQEVKPEIKKIEPVKPEVKPIPVAPIEAPKPEFAEYSVIKNTENKTMASVSLKDHNYFLKEPEINDKDKILLNNLTEKFGSKILKKPELVGDKKFMVDIVQKLSKKLNLTFNMDYFDKIRYYFVRNLIGYGALDPLIQDLHVKEIHFMGLHKPIHISFNEEKDIETNIIFDNMQEVNKIIEKFFIRAKQKLTKESNYLDSDIAGLSIKAFYEFNLNDSKLDIKK